MNDPAHELARLATDVLADLVVIGAHDWYGATDPKLGSLAETLTQLVPCPVLVVHRKPAAPSVPAIRPPCA